MRARARRPVLHPPWQELRDHLLGGYEFAEETNDKLRLHRNVLPFAKLEMKDQELDAVIVKSIPGALEKGGYVIVKRG